jgi:glucosamine--fructose-6-phosphate aminotransferase (isomerizing)
LSRRLFSASGEILQQIIAALPKFKARQAPIIALITPGVAPPSGRADEVIVIPERDEVVGPIVASSPVQRLSDYLAVERGWDVDKPRNHAKSVTAE